MLVHRSTDGPRPQSGTTQVSTLRIKSETGEMVRPAWVLNVLFKVILLIICTYWLNGRAELENIWLELRASWPRAKYFPVRPDLTVNKHFIIWAFRFLSFRELRHLRGVYLISFCAFGVSWQLRKFASKVNSLSECSVSSLTHFLLVLPKKYFPGLYGSYANQAYNVFSALDIHLEDEVYRLYTRCKESHWCCKVYYKITMCVIHHGLIFVQHRSRHLILIDLLHRHVEVAWKFGMFSTLK